MNDKALSCVHTQISQNPRFEGNNEKGITVFYDIEGLSNYTDTDITTCIWPNYSPQVNKCPPQLPTFVLDDVHSVRVGSNVIDSYSYVPFEHWHNSRFLIRVWANDPTIDGSWISAGWIVANLTTASINILSNNILRVLIIEHVNLINNNYN